MQLGKSLYPVKGGRIFVRAAASITDGSYGTPKGDYSGAKIVIGIVELPKHVEVERTHEARLNDRLWLNAEESCRPRTYMSAGEVAECDIPHLLTQMQYAAGFLPDSMELFVRASLIPHPNSSMRWAFVTGVSAQALKAFATDGLYEYVTDKGFQLVDANTYNGDALMQVIRRPLWGPEGKYGVCTSMEPAAFKAFSEVERNKPSRDPLFTKFRERMAELMPEQHVYDAAYNEERRRVADEVMREIAGMQEAVMPSAEPPRPRMPTTRVRSADFR